MLTVPDGYREAMAAGNPIHIKMEYSDGTVLGDADIDAQTGVTLTESFNPDTDIKMGKSSCRQLQTRILVNDNTRYMHWASDFNLYFGVEDGEGETIWVYFGVFIGQRPKNTTTLDAVDYIAYDQMILFDEIADDYLDSLSWSRKVSTLLSGISSQVGIPVVFVDCLETPFDRSIANRFSNASYTYRKLIELLAETCGCYARIGGYNMEACELVFFDFDNNPRIVTQDEIFHEEHADLYAGMRWDEFDTYTWNEADQMTWKDVCKYYKDMNAFDGVYVPKIDGGIIGRYPTNVKKGHIYSFDGNPVPKVTSSTGVTNYVQPVYERLLTIGGSLPMQVECVGDLVTRAGDVIKVELPEGIVEMPIFYKTMHWNGALTDIYETTAPDK